MDGRISTGPVRAPRNSRLYMSVHLFGVRHHGPGSARSLVTALAELQPDILLLEGPADVTDMFEYAGHEQMLPPVALLVYAAEAPKRAAFYPFAEFSPEWQTIQYALEKKIPIRFMDLPQMYQLLPKPEDEPKKIDPAGDGGSNENEDDEGDEGEETPGGTVADDVESLEKPIDPEEDERQKIRRDPIGWAARAAGHTDGERWWEWLVEQRKGQAFEAIHELMTALRAEAGPELDIVEQRREAFMRQTLRAAVKEGFSKIAVVCGAWHTPALATMPSVKEDTELLKGLPKTKVVSTWIPWTFDRLSRRSGYGAGIRSPGWYEHLWEQRNAEDILSSWMTKTARCFRQEGIDISPAHAIEGARLAHTLAVLRLTPQPGLNEVCEAVQTVFCFGSSVQMQLIDEKLIVGERMGTVPDDIPKLPLVQDVAKEQKRLRLPPEAGEKVLDLDLRKPNDLDRSFLIRRLSILGLNWGKVQEVSGKTGTFHEFWKLRWRPEFAVEMVEASVWGNTVLESAEAKLIDEAEEAKLLPKLTEMLEVGLQAQLGGAVQVLLRRVDEVAAATSDVPHLMLALPPLVNVQRYGDVRKTDTSAVGHVIRGLITRLCIGLPGACSALDDDASEAMYEAMTAVDQAVRILKETEYKDLWYEALEKVGSSGGSGGLVGGRGTRLLFEGQIITADELRRRVGLALSMALPAPVVGAWAEGLLRGSGLVLLHHPELLALIDTWVSGLTEDTFRSLLPLLRRTFATFPKPERNQMGEKLKEGTGAEAAKAVVIEDDIDWDRARLVLPTLGKMLGLETKS